MRFDIFHKGKKKGYIMYGTGGFSGNCGWYILSPVSIIGTLTPEERKIAWHLMVRTLSFTNITAYLMSLRTDNNDVDVIKHLGIKTAVTPGKYSPNYQMVMGLITKKKADKLLARRFLKDWEIKQA